MRRFLLFILVLYGFAQHAQQRFSSADAVFSNTVIVVRFTLAAGPVCSGYSIWYTADSTAPFQEIHSYPGVCGDPAQSLDYTYLHTGFVPNAVNFYKVRLEPSSEFSQIIRVYASERS